MNDYLKGVLVRRWKVAVVVFAVFAALGMLGYGEIHWIVFQVLDLEPGEERVVLAVFAFLHLLSFGGAVAVVSMYKTSIDTNIGELGPLQKRMLLAAIQTDIGGEEKKR